MSGGAFSCLGVIVSVALVLAHSPSSRAASRWEFDANIYVPSPNTLFLAIDSRGNVYATSFNSRTVEAEVLAMRIDSPAKTKPSVTIFDRYLAPPQRGYAGVACDGSDNIYVSLDAGEGQPSFIRKYLPTLAIDEKFGNGGTLATRQVRVLGLTAHKNKVLAAVSWGRFLAIDSQGNFLGMTPTPAITAYIRDIAYDPDTGRVYGVDRDGIFVFTGGSLDHLAKYTLRELIAPKSIPKAGSALFLNKKTNELFYTDRTAGGLNIYPLDGGQPGLIPAGMDGHAAFEPADAVASPDGRYLYVSDLRAPQIVRYRYVGPVSVDRTKKKQEAKPSPTPTAAPSSPSKRTELWITSFDEAKRLALRDGKMIVVFLHSPLASRSVEVAEKVFTENFLREFEGVIWVRLDVALDQRPLTEFGIYRVPAVLVLDPQGQEQQRFIGTLTQEQIRSFLKQGK